MEKFPEIKEGQAVLLRAETSSGLVLDELFDLAVNIDQKVFTIFNTVEEALESADKIINEKNNQVECIIYGKEQELLYYLNPNERK